MENKYKSSWTMPVRLAQLSLDSIIAVVNTKKRLEASSCIIVLPGQGQAVTEQ